MKPGVTQNGGKDKKVGFGLSLKGRALRLLSAREYSIFELTRKLKPFETEEGELQKLLLDLQAKDFINETRAVESFVYRRSPKLGANRIKQELQQRGLPAQDVAIAVHILHETEVQRCAAVWQSKFSTVPVDAKTLAKQMRFLLGRGFSAGVVNKVIKNAGLMDDLYMA